MSTLNQSGTITTNPHRILNDDEIFILLTSGCNPNFRSLSGILQDASVAGAMKYYRINANKNVSLDTLNEWYAIAQGVRLSEEDIRNLINNSMNETVVNMIENAAKFGYDTLVASM